MNNSYEHSLFQEARSFQRLKFEEDYELWGTDDV